jgi:hypothetical protein
MGRASSTRFDSTPYRGATTFTPSSASLPPSICSGEAIARLGRPCFLDLHELTRCYRRPLALAARRTIVRAFRGYPHRRGSRRPARPANADRGGVAEWLKAHAWKVCMRETVSRVRIPLPPPTRPRPKFSVAFQARKNPNKYGPSHINLRTATKQRRPKILSLRPFFSKPTDFANLVQNL